MSGVIPIGLDFHGTTFDHRLAKFLYFKLDVQVEYSCPFIDRSKILEELSHKGYSRSWYFDTLKEFFKSEWSLSGEISPGMEQFLDASPPNWRYLSISGESSNIESIRKIIGFSNLNKISGVYRVPDKEKIDLCKRLGVKIYFDDKPGIFKYFQGSGIKCVQISTEGYSEVSPLADMHFENWHEAHQKMGEIRKLVS